MKGVYFHSLAVEDLNKPDEPAKRDYGDSFEHLNDTFMKKKCTAKYAIFGDKSVDKCTSNIYAMCNEMCHDKSHREIENVLHYFCYKECIKVYRLKKKAAAAAEKLNESDDTNFKKGTKID